MKAKTVKAILVKKIDEWLESIEDENVRALAARDTIVTGGCIASMLLKEEVNDYDVYFRTKETTKAVSNYYVQRFKQKSTNGIPTRIFVEDYKDYRGEERIRIVVKSAGIASEEGSDKPYEYFENRPAEDAEQYVSSIMDILPDTNIEILQDPGNIQDTYEQTELNALQQPTQPIDPYRPVFLSTNAITLSGKIQIIIRFYGKPEELHQNYDYVHCTNYYVHQTKELVLQQKALESLLAKELVYVGSLYPVCSLFRMRKFIQRQWTINAGQIVKMAIQVSELDLRRIEVLQDQLVGVDCAYFVQVLNQIKQDNPEEINSSYLCEIIDRMF